MHSISVLIVISVITKSLGVSVDKTSAKWVLSTIINYDDLLPTHTTDSRFPIITNYYIGRNRQHGGALLGPIIRSTLYFAHNNRIESSSNFEVLVYPCKDFTWVKFTSGQSSWPDNFVGAGNDPKSNEDLFVCRASHTFDSKTGICLGKVSKSDKSCRVICDESKFNEIIKIGNFEVFAYTPTEPVKNNQQNGGAVQEIKTNNGYLIGLIVCAVLIPIVGIIAFIIGRKCCRSAEFEPMTIYK